MPSSSILADRNNSSASLSYDSTGTAVSAFLGHQFGVGLRVEEEVFYKRAVANKFTYSGITTDIDSNVWSIGAMSNLYYDWYHNVEVMDGYSFSPYIGAGIGFARVNMSEVAINSNAIWNSGSDTSLAYQVCIGSGVRITKDIILDISYRYFDTKDIKIDQIKTGFSNHNVILGIRYVFR